MDYKVDLPISRASLLKANWLELVMWIGAIPAVSVYAIENQLLVELLVGMAFVGKD